MRCVVQRVIDCRVEVDGETIAFMKKGLLVFLGVSVNDHDKDLEYSAEKVANLRAYPDENGKMNLSVKEAGGDVLVVSQFTLYGDTRKGRRPSYDLAAPPEKAEAFYEKFTALMRTKGLKVSTGKFQAHMHVEYTNDGPVTLLIDSEKKF